MNYFDQEFFLINSQNFRLFSIKLTNKNGTPVKKTWYLYKMVAQNVLRPCVENRHFLALTPNKCLEQISYLIPNIGTRVISVVQCKSRLKKGRIRIPGSDTKLLHEERRKNPLPTFLLIFFMHFFQSW